MHRLHELVWLAAVAGVGATACGTPAKAPAKPVSEAADSPESEVLNRTWIVDKHFMVKGSTLDAKDAKGFHGRTIEITSKGFMSPWQGTCADASRTLDRRDFASVVAELGVKPADQELLAKFGFDQQVAEFRLQCNDRESPPPFLVYLSNYKAMTCYRGACYLLILF
jgi:hypothetical protein